MMPLSEIVPATDVSVVVFSKSACVQCSATMRDLDRAGVEYKVVNLEEDPDALAYWVERGVRQAPIVTTPDGRQWAGYNRDQIKAIRPADMGGREQRTRPAASGFVGVGVGADLEPSRPGVGGHSVVGVGR